MARAPRPGSTGTRPGTNGQAAEQTSYEIVVRGEPVRMPLDMITVRDEALVRRETLKAYGFKQSLSSVINEMQSEDTAGVDAVALLWWLGRRKAGEDDLKLSDALDEFPTFAEIQEDEHVIDVRVTEPDGDEGDDLPEASGAASAPRGRSGATSSGSARGRSKT